MKHSHLFIALLIANTIVYVFINGTAEGYFHSTTGQGFALFAHWLLNLPSKKKPVDL